MDATSDTAFEAAEKMLLPYDTRLEECPQDETFTGQEVWDFASESCRVDSPCDEIVSLN